VLKTRTWIIIFALLILVCALLYLYLSNRSTSGTIANIYQDGVCIRSIDLSLVTEEYEFTVSDITGKNTILVEPGRIRVSHADCPDQICVDAGWLTNSASPIVCLPHLLVIKLETSAADNTDIDSVSK
jgi:hypothetical protein